MRKIILFVLLAISATVTKAQTNPKSGYVITNTGDTIRGIIDFRTNEKLSKQCDFWANGESTSKSYKPGDIEGFRFDHNGKYFVSRRLNVTGEPELYFAEFMVNGKMNLYCITYNSDEFYFFEREDGEIAELTNRATSYAGEGRQVLQEVKESLQEKREQYGKVKSLLQKSWKAVEGMDDNYMSRKKLINVVRDYHNDVYTDGGKCKVYAYNEKSDKVKAHLKAFAGYAYYSTEKTDHQHFIGENYPSGAFEIGIGVEIELERVLKGLSVELSLAYSPKTSSEHDVTDNRSIPYHSVYEKGSIPVHIGVVECFGKGKIRPLVRAGGFFVMHFGTKESYWHMETLNGINVPTWKYDEPWNDNTTPFGGYLGAGFQIALGKHYARLHGDLYKSLGGSAEMTRWGVTAEFAL